MLTWTVGSDELRQGRVNHYWSFRSSWKQAREGGGVVWTLFVRTSHLCEELTEAWESGGFARAVCATHMRENSLETFRQPRTLCRDALWGKLRTEQWAPLQVSWGQSTVTMTLPNHVTRGLVRAGTFSRSGDVTSFIYLFFFILGVLMPTSLLYLSLVMLLVLYLQTMLFAF